MTDVTEIHDWLNEINEEWVVYIKRLSANDTGLTGGHQVGIYIPKDAGTQFLPEIQRTDIKNPDHYLKASIDSHSLPEQTIRAIYYNNKYSENKANGRDEQRLTQWKKEIGESPVQDSENTGSLCIFAFYVTSDSRNSDYLKVWVCRNPDEEDLVESLVGEILPGEWLCGRYDQLMGGMFSLPPTANITYNLPAEWGTSFPTGMDIVDFVIKHYREEALDPDKRLIRRRQHEFAVFRAIEDLHVLIEIRDGFESVDSFVALANSVSNRRKSRSGRSLELHLERIFSEQGLNSYSTQCITEANKKPDFLFPSCEKYHDSDWPVERLRMLAVKTTCKDRWRQIINEANRIDSPYLFTLQEGVSENQFNEMVQEGVKLVVPEPLHKKYPDTIRSGLLSLNDFITSTISFLG